MSCCEEGSHEFQFSPECSSATARFTTLSRCQADHFWQRSFTFAIRCILNLSKSLSQRFGASTESSAADLDARRHPLQILRNGADDSGSWR